MNEYWRILGTDPLSVWDGKGRSPTRDEVQDHIERIGQLIWEIWIRYEQEQNWVGDISSRTQATLGRRDVYSELQKQEEEGHLSHGERDIASTLASYLKSPESLEQVEGHLAHDITDGDTKKSKGNSQPMPQLEAGKTGFDLVALRIRSACEAYQDGWNMVEATEDGYGISAVEKGFEGDLEGSALKGEGNADWEFCG
ncbi:MAG: hypothetical protein LQ338_003303 [Usnochroma carphineum]|nr:MAG: hypothetical protein LQ338_003303 [Usnochroma carphineum]